MAVCVCDLVKHIHDVSFKETDLPPQNYSTVFSIYIFFSRLTVCEQISGKSEKNTEIRPFP